MRTIVNNTSLPGFFAATAMPDPDWWQALWSEPEKVFAALGVPSGLKVVDLCCGDGLFTVPLARMSRHVIGIDIDPGMLALTRAKLTAGGATNCDLISKRLAFLLVRIGATPSFVRIRRIAVQSLARSREESSSCLIANRNSRCTFSPINAAHCLLLSSKATGNIYFPCGAGAAVLSAVHVIRFKPGPMTFFPNSPYGIEQFQ